MAILTLPGELLLKICEYLDTFSMVALSETCTKFELFFKNNTSCRKVVFNPSYGEGIRFDSIMRFLRVNSLHITHLNFSYVHWYSRSELVRAVLVLKHLKHINLIGSNLTTAFLITEGEQRHIDSFSFSLAPRDGLYLLYNMMLVNIVNHFHMPIREMGADVETFVTEIVLKAVNMDKDILFNIFVIPKNIPIISIKLKYSHALEVRRIPNVYPFIDSLIYKFIEDKCEDDFFVLETLTGIYVSHKLIQENPIVSNSIDIKVVSDLSNEHIVNLHMFHISDEIKFEDILERVNKIIERRSTECISVYGWKNCPENGFSIEEYLSGFNNIKHLSLQSCCLSVKAAAPDNTVYLFKRARVSRINNGSENEDPLKTIAEKHTQIKVLQIKHIIKHHDCNIMKMTSPNWAINNTYLDSVSEFKNLKYLTISNVPILSTDVFTKIFEGCTLLESLYFRNRSVDMTIIENLPKSLHLAKRLKILELKIFVRDINLFIELFPSCPSLLVINLIHSTNMLSKEKLVTPESISTILQMCPNITYLGIVEVNDDMTPSYKRKLKLLEKKLSYLNYRLLLNLTLQKDYMLYSLNDIGEFL